MLMLISQLKNAFDKGFCDNVFDRHSFSIVPHISDEWTCNTQTTQIDVRTSGCCRESAEPCFFFVCLFFIQVHLK